MTAKTKKEARVLRNSANRHSKKHGEELIDQAIRETDVLWAWLGFLRATVSKGVADRLLDAVQATVIEISGCISLGLLRPAIFSIRAQLELVLAWTYFNDHPVEWEFFERTGRDYPLRADVRRYLTKFDERFEDRYRILSAKKTRSKEDPYDVLSIHVHSTSPYSAPVAGSFAALVQRKKRCVECIQLQAEVAEYLTDTLAARYADRWQDLPVEVVDSIKARLKAQELQKFCS